MIQIVWTTFPDAEQAKKAARHLVKGQFAACGTMVPNATSIYSWEGVLEEAAECLLILKTTADRLQDLQAEILKIHPYKVPEIVSLPSDSAHIAYAEWVASQCRPQSSSS